MTDPAAWAVLATTLRSTDESTALVIRIRHFEVEGEVVELIEATRR